MKSVMKEYRRLVRKRRKALAFFEGLSEAELQVLTKAVSTVRERSALAVAAATRELSNTGVEFEHPEARDLFNMLLELSPNGSVAVTTDGSEEKYWLFMDLALAIWKRLQEQEEATQEILQNKELMRQIRESEEDYKAGRQESFIPWRP